MARKQSARTRRRTTRSGSKNASGRRRTSARAKDEWLRTFDERNLVFLFQEHQNIGRPSNHFHLDSPYRDAA